MPAVDHATAALVLQRQHLTRPARPDEYPGLFRRMSPVRTVYWCRPGSPPSLVGRAAFDDTAWCSEMRAQRTLVKGRFQNGAIAYVFASDLALFGAAYRKDPRALSPEEVAMLRVLQEEGPMAIGQIRDATGLPARHIAPVLHRLQERFLVFEDQVDDEWDRAWYPFEAEFPDVDLDQYTRVEAIQEAILRFAFLNVRIDADMARSFYQFPARDIRAALEVLERQGQLTGAGGAYTLVSDASGEHGERLDPPHGVFVLHRNDFLVKSNEHWLKPRFRHAAYDVLQYVLVDGAFRGAVYGRFRNGPFEIEDVALDAPAAEAHKLRDDVLAAVGVVNNPEHSPVKRYMGRAMR